jgi:DNA-binding MarR family transcriptional regulator
MREADRRMLDEIADDFIDSILVLSRRVSKGAPHPGAKKFDPSRFVLKKVEELGPIRMSEIGRHMEISKPYMTALVNKLIRDGLVERSTEPGDRRVVNIRITVRGRAVLSEFKKKARETVIMRLSSLDSQDISSLHGSVKNIKRIASKLDPDSAKDPSQDRS